MLQDVARPAAAPAETTSSPGRIVIQAWLASRGLIVAVALLLAVVQHRTLTDMVSNWDVQHFARLADRWLLLRTKRHFDGILPRLAADLVAVRSAGGAGRRSAE